MWEFGSPKNSNVCPSFGSPKNSNVCPSFNLLLALPFANMNWVGFISFICMLVAIVLWPFNIVKLETICYAYASHITLQFMPIYVYTKPRGSPLKNISPLSGF